MLDISSTRCILCKMNSDLQSLAALLRESRDRLGLTLRGVEEKTGISNAYLSQLEGAKIKQPSPQVLHKLCTFFECSYAVVMGMAGYPLPGMEKAAVNARFVARLGKTTETEEAALLEYLHFLRSRKR
jgi:transcriptional regulator with XRE-family HTH domain